MKNDNVKYEKVLEYLPPSVVCKLDNDVIICPIGDSAFGTDGKIYHYIAEEDSDGGLIMLGWSSEIDENVILNHIEKQEA